MSGIFAAGLNDYLRRVLRYEDERVYEISGSVRPWSYGSFENRYVDASETLRQAMSTNPHLQLFVACGHYDLATPQLAMRYTVDHLMLTPRASGDVQTVSGNNLGSCPLLCSFFRKGRQSMKTCRVAATMFVLGFGGAAPGQPTISQVVDLTPGPDHSHPLDFTIVDDELHFIAAGGIYKTDGANVTQVPGAFARELTVYQDRLYFTDYSQLQYVEDGIVRNTQVDLSGFGPIHDLTASGDHLYFIARRDSTTGLFATDANDVRRLIPSDDGLVRTANDLTPFGGRLYFSGRGPSGSELYWTDGTDVVLVEDLNPSGDGLDRLGSGLTVVHGEMLFAGFDGPASTDSLFRSDGETISKVSDLQPVERYYDGQRLPFHSSTDEAFVLAETDDLHRDDVRRITDDGLEPVLFDGFESFALMTFLEDSPFIVSPSIGRDILRFYVGDDDGLTEIEGFQSDASFPPREFIQFNGNLYFSAKGQSGFELHKLTIHSIDACDLDAGGSCDSDDINLLTAAVRSGDYQSELDLNEDQQLDQLDRVFWVEELMNTDFGDANLDGRIDQTDFELFASSLFTLETGWDRGDFNGDGLTDVADFNLWNDNSEIAAARSVPEPCGAAMIGIALAIGCL